MRTINLIVLLVASVTLHAGDAPPTQFIAFDSSHLMGSPETYTTFGIERAFDKLQFARPVDITHAKDGTNRLFVVEQDGRILVFKNNRDIEKADVFLDIRAKVRRGHNEEGLLGLAFHPDFKTNGEFFVFYNFDPQNSTLARYRVSKDNPNQADPASEERLLEFAKPFGNHNGGSIHFGPDGFLYIAIGDGGSGHDPHGNGQKMTTWLGKILRIDVNSKANGKNYAVPADNPFNNQGDKALPEIWAYGLRNVWRMSFDRKTGTLWAADVGQDKLEEVNIIRRGGNYGWKLREGKQPRDSKDPGNPADFIEPLVDYPRDEGKSITGGVVYRGKRVPALDGAYLYADFITGNIWALRGEKPADKGEKITRSSLTVAAFGEDEAGEAYMTSFDGYIYRFKDTPTPPANFPRKLSETKLFSSVKDHAPAPSLIPYSVNMPLWSDGADKQRFIVLPKNASMVWKENDHWELPLGSIVVKTFELPLDVAAPDKKIRLETRLIMNTPRGWDGVTYIWNEEQTDADLLDDVAVEKEFTIKTAKGVENLKWYFPSRANCHACHTNSIGFVLGLNTRQLNRAHEKSGPNQIDTFTALKLFATAPTVEAAKLPAHPDWDKRHAAPLNDVARAYLDANCANCHNPGGAGTAGSPADLRVHIPLEKGMPPPKPDGETWFKHGDLTKSVAWQRMSVRNARQMPPLATNRVDEEAVKLLKEWIEKGPLK